MHYTRNLLNALFSKHFTYFTCSVGYNINRCFQHDCKYYMKHINIKIQFVCTGYIFRSVLRNHSTMYVFLIHRPSLICIYFQVEQFKINSEYNLPLKDVNSNIHKVVERKKALKPAGP